VVLAVTLLVSGVLASVFYNMNVTIPSTVTVTAPTTYTLTVNVASGQSTWGSVAGGQVGATSGTPYSISATANAGYHFVNWTGDVTGTSNPATGTITTSMTVTANFAQNPVVASLYTDLDCTVPVTPSFLEDFGTIGVGGNTVTKIVYFKASSSNSAPQPTGYGFGEVNPLTVVATSNINPAVATFSYVVGEPFGAVVNGNHPCMITLSVTPVGVGVSSFNITVTGNGP
jgi:hypothetical protein